MIGPRPMRARRCDAGSAPRSGRRFVLILLAAGMWLPYPSRLLGQDAPPIDFDTQIIPVLTKIGCNAGACHGSAAGRGGLQLSLYGSRPADDYAALVQQYHGRRIDLRQPGQSLMLLKPGGELEHGGDHLFDLDDEAARLLKDWIAEGAQRHLRRHLSHLEIKPNDADIQAGQSNLTVAVHAVFDDGSDEDVTRWTRFEPADPGSIEIDGQSGQFTWQRPGRHLIIARYLDRVEPIELLVPLPEQPEVAPFMTISPELIDGHIDRRLRRLGLRPAPLVDDATFLRRLSLDLRGRLPTPEEVTEFLRDASPDKREREIREQLESDEFVSLWAWYLAGQLRLRSLPGDATGVAKYFQWLRQRVAQDDPWDQTVRALVTATGDTHQAGPAYFFRSASDPRLQSEFITESLLGVRLRCANCHDHPLDRWTQDDYHGLAAILATVDAGRVIRQRAGGQVIHPVTLSPAVAKVPGQPAAGAETDRTLLAEWMVDRQNPYFAKAQVNRIWARLMGRGLVQPVDDLRATNPPTHPALLRDLEAAWQAAGYRLKPLIERICRSQAYQRGYRRDEQLALAQDYYAVSGPRPLPAALLADAIDDVTGVASKYPGRPDQSQAIELIDAAQPAEALDLLGRCRPGDGCSMEGPANAGGLRRELHLLNGELINEKLASPKSRLSRRIDAGASVAELLDEFYLRALGRPLEVKQRQRWIAEIEDADPARISAEERQHLEDWMWGLLTCREFTTNH